jgi:hypothetical protein
LKLLSGRLIIRELRLPFLKDRKVESVHSGATPMEFISENGTILMVTDVTIEKAGILEITFK